MSADEERDRQILTGGGSYTEGGVETGGGDFVARDKHVHLDASRAPDGTEKRGKVPPLLPYRPDRCDQLDEFDRALKRLYQDRSRLLICLIHGDDRQCHDKFLECLQKISLPQRLGLKAEEGAVERHFLMWPQTFTSTQEFHDELWRNLGKLFLDDKEAERDKISNVLAGRRHFIIYTSLLTEDWIESGPTALESFFEFCQKELWFSYCTVRLFVFVLITYQSPPRLKFYTRWRCKSANSQFSKLLEALERDAPLKYSKLFCASLPRLDNIQQSDAENWAHEHREIIKRFCGRDCQEMLDKIRDFYQEWKMRAVPMRDLADRLKVLLGG